MEPSARQRIKALVRISESTVWSRDPEAASQKTVDVLAEILGCKFACIHVLDASGDSLFLCAVHRNSTVDVQSNTPLTMSTGRMLWMMTAHQPIFMDFTHPDPEDEIPRDTRGFKSAVSVPLMAGEEMLGMFTLVYDNEQHWTEQDTDDLLDIGRLLGVAVQHSRIARKSADLEILLERKRLSGEIHDHLSPLINTINIGVETALLSLEEGDDSRLLKDLGRIQTIGKEAARALREELLSLRSAGSEGEGLLSQIREHLARFSQQWKIETELQVQEGLEPLIVSSQMEMQFMRILHESLANVLRHAIATHVVVLLQGDRYRLGMQILDNGRGFNPEDVAPERLGLRIMRERAETLGGQLTIESNSESGTMVRVDAPRYS